MITQEDIFELFRTRVSDIIYRYTTSTSAPLSNNPYLKMLCYFSDFNSNLIELESELNIETVNILSNYVNEDMDLPNIIDNLCSFSNNAKLQYIQSREPVFN
jgi:hypothetical protein